MRGTAVCDDSRPSTPTKLKAVQVEPAAVGDDGYSLDILSPSSTGEQVYGPFRWVSLLHSSVVVMQQMNFVALCAQCGHNPVLCGHKL